VRSLILSGVIVGGMSAILFGRQAATPAARDLPQLSYVTTAHQLGVVGYRDPVGAISPDGTRLAYSEGRFIRVVPIGGGAPVTLAPGEGQIRALTWKGNDEVVAQDATRMARWWLYRLGDADRKPLWDPQLALTFSQVTFSADGRSAAALALIQTGPELVRLDANGNVVERIRLKGRVSFLTYRNNDTACVINLHVTTPCGGAPLNVTGTHEVHGPIAFSPDGNTLFYSTPNERGMVELWSADLPNRRTRRLSNFSRDAYAPSVAADGTVVFKTQSYRTHLADVAFEGGATRQLTTFQSETPSYHPTRPLIAFTYGTWRRIIDDAKYPDIAQEIGVVDVSQSLPAAKPSEVLEESDSEDQAMTWSPNGKWIAFHSHREMSDDVWLRSASAEATADRTADKRITFLGRGAEVGWPRWSPDGRSVLLNGARKSDGASVLYAIGVNQDTGATTSELREINVTGVTGEMGHAEWMPDSRTVVATAKEGPGRHVIFTVPAAGGRATIVHRYATEHDFSGIGVSTSGRFVAFVAPAPDGFFQIFVKTIGGTTLPVQLTTDRSHKTQPTFSPDGGRVAFTVWSYEAAFWSFNSR
jgi:Tol biopolymer transport system component